MGETINILGFFGSLALLKWMTIKWPPTDLQSEYRKIREESEVEWLQYQAKVRANTKPQSKLAPVAKRREGNNE